MVNIKQSLCLTSVIQSNCNYLQFANVADRRLQARVNTEQRIKFTDWRLKFMKLKNHPYEQCSVRELIDGSVVFTSYNTDVIYIDKDGWLSVSGLYSATTKKQIGYFLKEYVPQLNYYDIKCAYYSNHMINIHTGEIKNL